MSRNKGASRREVGAANVMITSAGRRTGLVRAFAEAAHARGGRVLATDVDGLAPALYLADEAVRTLPLRDAGYSDDLLAKVVSHDIRLVVPTIDTELPILAANRSRFEAVGCRVAISAASFIETSMDKHLTALAFGSFGIRVPKSWIPPIPASVEIPITVFVKPRSGSASQNTFQIGREDLDAILRVVPDPIIQEVLTGPEITIDALLDFDGRVIHYVPRRRIRTLGGESIQGVTLEHDSGFEAWIEDLLGHCASLGGVGPLTMQAFLTPEGPVLTEINARFGGGFPLAHAAGAEYPAWLLDMIEGAAVRPRLREYEAGLYMTRSSAELFTRQPKW